MNLVSKITLLSSAASLLMAPAAFATDTGTATINANLNANVGVGVNVGKNKNKTTLNAEQRACVAAAVTKRDNAIIAALDTYHVAWKAALETRRDALTKAWNTENRNDRIKAQREAWSAFQKAHRTARETFRTTRLNAWTTFKTDHKACSPRAAAENVGNSSVDAG